jgi:hypothetical protein
MLIAISIHDSSSQSHPSLHMCVWLLLLGPEWPLSCNNPPNGQISLHGDTKQIGLRPSFRRLQHTLTALFFHDSSSRSHPSLHNCVFGYFCWGPNWPLSCKIPPNGQISPHGDTKQMEARSSFRRPRHTPTSLYFHDSSSQSHPSLHMCVWLLLLGS